jgi:hypothetical protein
VKYYLQDKRTIVGNSMSWWAIDGRGYTCDIRCAHIWTEEELKKEGYWSDHYKYKPWPKDRVDRLVQLHIDHQDLERKTNGSIFDNNPHTLVKWRKDLTT